MKNRSKQSIYIRMHRFAGITRQLILNGNIARAKKCLKIAENILKLGNNIERNAISNVFVFEVSTFLEIHRYNGPVLLPALLQAEYIKQVNSSCA